MSLLKKQCSQSAGLGYSSYILIAQAFNKLPDADGCREGAVTVKFDITYFVATENLPYTKKICELEMLHGVCVGTLYINENGGKEYILECWNNVMCTDSGSDSDSN